MNGHQLPFGFESALIITIPKTYWLPIEQVRTKHDKAAYRWPPHINLIFPFVIDEDDNFEQVSQALRFELGTFPAFQLRIGGELGYFPQKKEKTVHLKPSTNPPNALEDLHERLASVFPRIKLEKEFHPHLTIGQWPSSTQMKDIRQLAKNSGIVDFGSITIDRLFMISRSRANSKVPFAFRRIVPLHGFTGADCPLWTGFQLSQYSIDSNSSSDSSSSSSDSSDSSSSGSSSSDSAEINTFGTFSLSSDTKEFVAQFTEGPSGGLARFQIPKKVNSNS